MMFQVLKVPSEKISDKMIADVKQRVTSIRDVLDREVSIEELRQALQEGFSEALDIDLVRGQLNAEEQHDAKKLAAEKYSTYEWNFKR